MQRRFEALRRIRKITNWSLQSKQRAAVTRKQSRPQLWKATLWFDRLGWKVTTKKTEENTRETQKHSVSKASVQAPPLHPLLSDKLRNPLLSRRINKSALRSSSGPAVWRFRPQRSFARHIPVYISSKHPSCVHVRIISFWLLWLYLQNIWLALSRFWTHPWFHQTDPSMFTFCWFFFFYMLNSIPRAVKRRKTSLAEVVFESFGKTRKNTFFF